MRLSEGGRKNCFMNKDITQEPIAPASPVIAQVPTAPAVTFESLGIGSEILAVLAKNKFTVPTPIQHQSIPVAIDGKDVIGIAQTGTGKTLAFGIPMVEQLLKNPNARGAIILPTRELAMQVEETLRKIGGLLRINSVVLIGGASMYHQKLDLKRNPRIIIATPGRLIDHLEQRTLDLSAISILVLDEADRMLDMGFAPQLAKIMKAVPKERQTMLFSATMPAEITKIALNHMKTPLRIEVAPAGTSAANVEQEMIVVRKEAKFPLLSKILQEHKTSALVFTRTKHGAHKVCRWLGQMNVNAAEIHSDRSLGQRIKALEGFKSGFFRVLVATDIAARGIDVKNIGLVVNYDLPENNEDYVHRIGRTGRAGATGKAVSFVMPDQLRDVKDIERLIRKPIPMRHHETVSGDMLNIPKESMESSRGGYRSGGSGGSRGGYRSGGSSSFGRSDNRGRSFSSAPRRSSESGQGFFPEQQRVAGGRPPNPYYRVGMGDTGTPAPAPRSFAQKKPDFAQDDRRSRPYHARPEGGVK